MKLLKIISWLGIVILMIISVSLFANNAIAKSKTLNDLKNQLQVLENNNANTQNNIKNNEKQTQQARSDVNQTIVNINNIEKEVEAKTNLINQLGIDIQNKDQEIKNLISFLQMSSSGSTYLEYIAGAETLTDFIYRYAIVENLVQHDSDLMKEMNQKIEESKAAQEELNKEKIELADKKVTLSKKIQTLGSQKNELYEYAQSLADEIKNARSVISMYEKAGCKGSDDINVCANKLLPPDTRFWRPIEKGCITSEYGWRSHPISHTWRFHNGTDMSYSANRYNTNVYAAASGKVAKIGYDGSQGNYIIIHHNINGKNYTTQYLHLKTGSINVSVGSLVSKDTVLAIMGSTGDSTGPHLHFTVATGLRYKDYVSYDDFIAHTVNPRSMVNFPSGSKCWANRTTKYS